MTTMCPIPAAVAPLHHIAVQHSKPASAPRKLVRASRADNPGANYDYVKVRAAHVIDSREKYQRSVRWFANLV
jgi:hypothetical protein